MTFLFLSLLSLTCHIIPLPDCRAYVSHPRARLLLPPRVSRPDRSRMTLLTPTLRQQMAATAARHASQTPPALSCATASRTTQTPSASRPPPPTSLSCSTSPCFCKPSFRLPTLDGPASLLIGHVDEPDDTPLREWLPGCSWTGEWRRYACGHHSTELTVEHAGYDQALRRLTAAGWKQLSPPSTFYLVVDEQQPERVTAMLRDALHSTSLQAHMAWCAFGPRLLSYPAQSSLTCARHELQRTLSGLHELGFGERTPDVEGRELSCSSKQLQRCWSSAALLRGKDGSKRRTLVATPRAGSVGKREDRPLVKRSSDGRRGGRTATAAILTDSSTRGSATTAAERPFVETLAAVGRTEEAEEASVSQPSAVNERREEAECEGEAEEDGWVMLDAAHAYPAC